MLSKDSVYIKSRRIKFLIFIATVILIVLMFPQGESLESEVTLGSIWLEEDLIATTSFPIYKNPEVYKIEQKRAAEKVYPIFVYKPNLSVQIKDSLKSFSEYLLKIIDNEIKPNEGENDKLVLKTTSLKMYNEILRITGNPRSARKKIQEVLTSVSELINRVYQKEILNQLYNEIKKDSVAKRVGRVDYVEPKLKYNDLKIVYDFVADEVNRMTQDQQLRNVVAEFINHFVRPNLIYDDKLTLEEINHVQDKVSPNIGIVNENERIIAKHDRVTEEDKLKIDSYRKAKAEISSLISNLTQSLGKFLHILLILTLYGIYLFLFRKKIFYDNIKVLLIAIIILFNGFLTYLLTNLQVGSPIYLLAILPAASMLLTIIFDSRVGFYGTVVIALITGSLRGNDYTFTAMNIFAGSLGAYTVRDIKNRTQIFRSFIYILLGYVVSILAFGLERYETADKILIEFAFASANALFSPVFTFGMIIFFERFFKITTDLTLLELTDFNRPLLKELAKIAPGTFTHSITVGSMVERAAESIKANPLLARVGAYYHDIGKTINSDYFVENQMDNENSHEKLNPKQSTEIIINHVSKGIELAEKEKLPKEIVDFIPMHHGTQVVSYFYEKAKELYGAENISIQDFRYTGPRPNTKETALVMLADACESTVRSIDEPEPAKIENVVNSLIKQRVDDGQLDESPITLSDLKLIKETFLNILLGQYHKRIRYPKQDEMENVKDSG